MISHDSTDKTGAVSEEEIISKISPEFSELTLDIQEIFKMSKNPGFVSALLYKLVKEREETNKLLKEINSKYEKILKNIAGDKPQNQVLSEADQMIMHQVKEQGQVEAKDIKQLLGYKNKNAASQRLNRLYEGGHLKKIRAGRKVVYLAKN